VSAFGSPYTPYPPVQNGKEKRGGLILPADYTRLVTAAERTRLALLGNPPRARVYYSGVQSIATGVVTAIVFDNSRYNSPGSTGGVNPWVAGNLTRLTVPAGGGGTYRMSGVVYFPPSNLGTTRITGIRLNGVAGNLLSVAEGRPSAATGALPSCATDYALVAGDYLELVAYQDTGGAFGVGAAAVTYGSELTFARCSD
jgi:hypothetical protein